MSVINTMLKDLEKRGGSDAAGDAILKGLSANSSPGDNQDSNKVSFYLVSALSVSVVFLGIVVFYLVSPYQLVVAEKNQQLVTANQASLPVEKVDVADVVKGNDKTNKSAELVIEPVQVQQQEVLPEVVAGMDKSTNNAEKLSVKPEPVLNPVRREVMVTEAMSVAAIEEEIDAEQVISKTQREPTRQAKSQDAYLKALSMYNRGRVQESRDLLKDSLNYDVFNLDARKLLASMYLREGRAGVAVAVIEKGLTSYSDNQELLRLYLQAQAQLENYAEAIKVMEQRLRLTTPEDIAYLAGLYQKNAGHLNAVKLYTQALQLKPGKSVWWMGQGISFEALSQKEQALRSYQQSIVSGQLSTQLAGYVKGRINTIEQLQLKSTS